MCAGPEDGHPAARRRRVRGEEGESDPQVSAKHLGRDRSARLRHAGERGESSCVASSLAPMSVSGVVALCSHLTSYPWAAVLRFLHRGV